MCHIWPCMISSTSIENQNFTIFSLWNFCMIPVWFLGNHIWSLYDYQDFIQILYDLVWLLKIINDLVRNRKMLYDRWPGWAASPEKKRAWRSRSIFTTLVRLCIFSCTNYFHDWNFGFWFRTLDLNCSSVVNRSHLAKAGTISSWLVNLRSFDKFVPFSLSKLSPPTLHSNVDYLRPLHFTLLPNPCHQINNSECVFKSHPISSLGT